VLVTACGGGSNSKPTEKERQIKESAVINVQLASGYIRRGDLEVAERKLLKAIEHDRKYVPAYTTMAVLKSMIGDLEEAEDYYAKAIDLDPRNPELHNNYGTFLCNSGKLEEAYEEFQKALRNQFYATPETAHANLGYCLLQADKPNFALAERHLRSALKVDPNQASALLAMGELGLRSNKYLMARAYMQRYHSVARPSAATLWLQIQVEHALGDKDFVHKLSRTLIEDFPESPEAAKAMELSYQ
jgi:type IV pilus assembly protein PilF